MQKETLTVINFGRNLFAAPAITYSRKSAFVMVSFELPFINQLLHGIVEVNHHNNTGFYRQSKQGTMKPTATATDKFTPQK